MDWLTFKFCVIIWVLCVSKSQSQLLNSTNPVCVKGQLIAPPDECNTCICFEGRIYCTHLPCPAQECFSDAVIPRPDQCNSCVCRRGKVACSDLICIPAPHCVDKVLYPAQNKCNTCMCQNGFIMCTSNICDEKHMPIIKSGVHQRAKISRKKQCVEGQPMAGPNRCLECHCFKGKKRCRDICNATIWENMESERHQKLEKRVGGVKEPECVSGQHIPKPDDCNNCICFEGQIHCTNLPCRVDTRIGPECSDDQPVYRPDECNECYCFNGRLECSDLVCIRGSKCVEGQEIPKPDSCNVCKCFEGHILCTDYQCSIAVSRHSLGPGSSSMEVQPLDQCQEGDDIPPPPPPNDCNTCFCLGNRIVCTLIGCTDSMPEIEGRLKQQNEQNNLEVFDKKMSVEPFINMLYKNNDKRPTKLIHTHAYNGFHQEIKVHSNYLPKDTTNLLKVLATSLDNPALAGISDRLASPSDAHRNNSESKKQFVDQGNQTNLSPDPSSDGNVLTKFLDSPEINLIKSSKLIASGSQSNETILVIPSPASDSQNSQSVLPITNKHETFWNTVSSPAPVVYKNIHQKLPNNSEEEKLQDYHYDNPLSMINNDYDKMIRNPSKLARPGHHNFFKSINPTRNTVEMPNKNTPSTNPMLPLNPRPNNINHGKMSYLPLSQENKQFTPIPPRIISKHELQHLHPYQQAKPGNKFILNYTSSHPIFKPGQEKNIATSYNKGGQNSPSQPRFEPNPSMYQVKPQQYQFNPNQNHYLPTLNNKGSQYPHIFPNNPNQTKINQSKSKSVNPFNPPQFGLKPGQESVGFLNNKGDQTDPLFKSFPQTNNFQIKSPYINQPDKEKRKSITENEGSKQVPPLSNFVSNSTAYQTNNQGKFLPSLLNKGKYNTTHSHYETHSTFTYVSEYDPTDQVGQNPNQHHNAPHKNAYGYNSPEKVQPDQGSHELDSTLSKVNYYLNLPHLQLDQHDPHDTNSKFTQRYPAQTVFNPGQRQNDTLKVYPKTSEVNKYSQHNPWNKSTFDKYFHPPRDSQLNTYKIKPNQNQTGPTIPRYPNVLNTYPHSPTHSEFKVLQDKSKPGVLNDQGSANIFPHTSNFDAAHLKDNLHKPLHPQFDRHAANVDPAHLKDNLHKPSVSQFDPYTSNVDPVNPKDKIHKLQHSQFVPHFSSVDPAHLKDNLHKSLHSQFDPVQNLHPPGIFDDRGSADGFQYPSNTAESPTHPKGSIHQHPHSKFKDPHSQHLPGVFDDRGVNKEFQYAHNAGEDLTHTKPIYKLPYSKLETPQNQHKPGVFDDRASTDGFQYISNSAEDPTHTKVNLYKPLKSQFGPPKDQHLPGMLNDRASADGFQYISNSAEDTSHSKSNLHKPSNSQFGPPKNQHLPGVFNDRASADGFQYISNSAEEPTRSKDNLHKPPNPQFGPPKDHRLPGVFDDRASANGFQYISDSAENPTHIKGNPHKPPNSQLRPPKDQYLSGVFDDRASADGFQYPSNTAEDATHPKGSIHQPPLSQFKDRHSPHLPRVFDDREVNKGFQYAHNADENPTHTQPIHKLPHSKLEMPQNQHTPGVFDDRASADGFQYISNSAEDPTHIKGNPHKPPNSQFGPPKDQHLPGVFDDRASADGFQYPSNTAEDPTHLKGSIHQPPLSQFKDRHSQHLPRVFDDREVNKGFQYAHNADENPTHTQPIHKLPHSKLEMPQNQHTPGVFDDRASADGFQYISNSAEDPTHIKGNPHKPPNSQFRPPKDQHLPRVFDDRASADGFQYPSNTAEDPTHAKGSIHQPPLTQFKDHHSQHLPRVFDDREVNKGFQYAHNADENPTHAKPIHNLPHSKLEMPQNQHVPGVFDDRASADGFQYISNSAEDPTHIKGNPHKPPNSQFRPPKDQHLPGVFDDRASADGFQYPSNTAEDLTHAKGSINQPPLTQFKDHYSQHLPRVFDDREVNKGFQYAHNADENPTHAKPIHNLPHSKLEMPQNQHVPEVLDDRASADGFQYISNSAEDPTHTKVNINKSPYSQLVSTQNQHTPGVFDVRESPDGFQNGHNADQDPSYSKYNPYKSPYPQLKSSQNKFKPGADRGNANEFQYPSNTAAGPTYSKDTLYQPPYSQSTPPQNQHIPVVLDDHESADGFQYISNSPEDPTSESKNKQPRNQSDPISVSDFYKLTDNDYNNNNPLRPWVQLDHDQYKPSSIDSLLNGIHNIPWTLPKDHKKVSNTVTSNPHLWSKPDHDQYKQSSVDNLFNGIHQIPWSPPNQNKHALISNTKMTTPRSRLKVKQDQYDPSLIDDSSWSRPNQNENIDISGVDDNQPQIEQDISTPPTDFVDPDNTQYISPHPQIKPDSDPESLLPIDDGKIPDYYDQLYPLFMAVKKLSEPPPIDDSEFSVGSLDHLDLLPFLFPAIAKSLNYKPSLVEDDASSVENQKVVKRIFPWSKQLPAYDNKILNWLKSKLKKLVPTKYNVTVTKNDIDMTKIFNLLSKLTPPKIKNTALHNIPYSAFNPETIENIINDFKENQTQTMTQSPSTDSISTNENRFRAVPEVPEKSRIQALQVKYPDVHIILHQPNEGDDVALPSFIETSPGSLASDMESEELGASFIPKLLNPRFRHRPKVQKEECGDGTEWISNCHGCSCYFGQAMCFKIPGCNLRPFGEPMTCKPYSHFKMGDCYACECNGDGVAECDATDCNTELGDKVSSSTALPLPVFNEFFDDEKTKDLIQYYSLYKKNPKDCPSQTKYPTCEPGTSWVSSCHKCKCNENSRHECVRIEDCELDYDSYGQPSQCKPNTKFYPKSTSMPCVECSCNDEGNPYCPSADYKKQ